MMPVAAPLLDSKVTVIEKCSVEKGSDEVRKKVEQETGAWKPAKVIGQ